LVSWHWRHVGSGDDARGKSTYRLAMYYDIRQCTARHGATNFRFARRRHTNTHAHAPTRTCKRRAARIERHTHIGETNPFGKVPSSNSASTKHKLVDLFTRGVPVAHGHGSSFRQGYYPHCVCPRFAGILNDVRVVQCISYRQRGALDGRRGLNHTVANESPKTYVKKYVGLRT
jgi:hypothetical protein